MVSLSSVTLVRNNVREAACENFHYVVHTVLGLCVSDEVCKYVQDVVEDEENALIPTLRPRTLGVSLVTYLKARGVNVLTDVDLPSKEILSWLDFPAPQSEKCCTVTLTPNGVELQWL